VFGDILRTHYILIYSTHNGDDAPQNSLPSFRDNSGAVEIGDYQGVNGKGRAVTEVFYACVRY
jgi:hypothetical protein